MAEITDQYRLDGKVAVVTGGSRGLGREMVLGLASAGADVVIASRNLDACERVADEVEQSTRSRAVAVACHVGRWEDCNALYESVYKLFGRADVLVNNAGMSPPYGPDIRELPQELWNKVIDVNLSGPFRLSALFGASMHEGDGGVIINISSGAAYRPTRDTIPYAAAKAGLHALTLGFADAFGPNVRVNAIVAGRFLTDVSKAWDLEALADQVRERQPLQRIAAPAEIVGTALYLASAASSYTTGAMIRVDGGAAI
jgi:NAD(P)-dependent dehydrogenase (short-subunit alcohol dehydrogenase family)